MTLQYPLSCHILCHYCFLFQVHFILVMTSGSTRKFVVGCWGNISEGAKIQNFDENCSFSHFFPAHCRVRASDMGVGAGAESLTRGKCPPCPPLGASAANDHITGFEQSGTFFIQAYVQFVQAFIH